MRQKLVDLGFPHLFGMASIMKFDKAPHPLDVALLCFIAIAFGAQNSPGLIEKLWAGIGSWLWRVFFQTSLSPLLGPRLLIFN